MSETIAAPQAGAPGQGPPPQAARNGEHPIGKSGAMLFSTLVLAHYRYFILHARYGELGGIPARYAPDGAMRPGEGSKRPSSASREDARREYDAALEAFFDSEGSVDSAYWCVFAPSGIAVTRKCQGRALGFLWRRDPVMRLYRESDWLTNAYADINVLLHHCDTVAAKVARVLRGTTKRIALDWLFSEERFLLAAAEERTRLRLAVRDGVLGGPDNGNPKGTDAGIDGQEDGLEGGSSRGSATGENGGGDNGGNPAVTAAVTPVPPVIGPWVPTSSVIQHAKHELIEIEKYYDRAAKKAARVTYFWGMMGGVAVALGLAALAALIVHRSFYTVDVDENEVRNFFVCFAAGALGAVVSVLTRMRREEGFDTDYEAGRWQPYLLGMFRPFIGAVFGLVVYFALKGDLLQIAVPDDIASTGAPDASFYFLALLAFLAGFSERLTKVVLGKTERSIEAAFGRDEGKVAAAATEQASRLELLIQLRQRGLLTQEQLDDAMRQVQSGESQVPAGYSNL